MSKEPTWQDRFEAMLNGLGWSYRKAAEAAGYRSENTLRSNVQRTGRPLPIGLKLAVLVYERAAVKIPQRNNIINVMQADEESGLYENEEEE